MNQIPCDQSCWALLTELRVCSRNRQERVVAGPPKGPGKTPPPFGESSALLASRRFPVSLNPLIWSSHEHLSAAECGSKYSFHGDLINISTISNREAGLKELPRMDTFTKSSQKETFGKSMKLQACPAQGAQGCARVEERELKSLIFSPLIEGMNQWGASPMCSSMKVLSVRATLLFPTLACPLFRMSSRTDFRLGNLRGTMHMLWSGNQLTELGDVLSPGLTPRQRRAPPASSWRRRFCWFRQMCHWKSFWASTCGWLSSL